MEVHLGFGRRQMGLRHKALLQRPTGLGGDLRAALTDVIAHRRVRQLARVVLVDQPRKNAPGGVALLLRRVQITAQHRVDRGLEWLQPRRRPGRRLALRRDRARQRLPHRPPVHVIPVRQLADRALLDPRIPSDRSEQPHPRSHPSTPSVITKPIGDHAQVGPHQAVTTAPACQRLGPDQTVTTTPNCRPSGANSNRHDGADSGCHGQAICQQPGGSRSRPAEGQTSADARIETPRLGKDDCGRARVRAEPFTADTTNSLLICQYTTGSAPPSINSRSASELSVRNEPRRYASSRRDNATAPLVMPQRGCAMLLLLLSHGDEVMNVELEIEGWDRPVKIDLVPPNSNRLE